MTEKYSAEAAEVWNLYADEFEKRWGIPRDVSAVIGARSKSLYAAEFMERGTRTYRDSVVLPIRNAFYSASQIDERWKVLKDMNLREPILDYGCGVGFQLVWLKRHGFKRLYGHELPGVQHKVMKSMFIKHGIQQWKCRFVNTVLCFNVLEHVKDPVALLEKLQMVGRRVIANICVDHDASHIASHEDLDICRSILEAKETLYRAA
jgi:methyltransferase family protein